MTATPLQKQNILNFQQNTIHSRCIPFLTGINHSLHILI